MALQQVVKKAVVDFFLCTLPCSCVILSTMLGFLFQMEPISLRHNNVESYMELLSQWLLEETRAQIQQNLVKVADMACTRIDIDSDIRPISKLSCLRRVTCTIDRNAFAMFERYKQPKTYHPAASDIVLLSTFAPQKTGDLFQADECFTLGVVQGGHMSGSSFEVIIYATTHGPVYAELVGGEKSWYAMKLESLVTCQRIWDSLHQPENTPLAQYVATYHSPQISETPVEESKLQKYCCTIRRLNLSQTEAVKRFIMRHLNPQQGYGVELIQGPPGTGKTSTLTAMLSATVCTSTRILVCAPTNTAVNEAARRFLLQNQRDQEDSQRVHFCSDYVHSACGVSSDSNSTCTPLRLGDIVMLGSEDRLAVEGSALKDIFLPLRVKRLLAALHPESGWEVLSRTFLFHLMEVSESTVKEPEQQTLDRIVIESVGRQVIGHGEVLCNDLPSSHLSTRRIKMIAAVSCSIRNLLELFTHENHNDGYTRLKEQSAAQDEVENDNNQRTKDLINDLKKSLSRPLKDSLVLSDDDDAQFSPNPYKDETVESCTHYSSDFIKESYTLLEILTANAEAPIFPPAAAKSADWVESECLSSASLVFSTVSSAALRIMKLGLPFSCVIVDEAAQLVEAESTIVLQMKDVKQLVLVGDQKQLPATVMSQLALKNGYARSLFERLQCLGHSCQLLNMQYRMHPTISAFPNKQFYNCKLKNSEDTLSENYGKLVYQKNIFGPYAFIDVSDGIEVNAGSSKKNVLEANLVLHLVKRVQDSVCANSKESGSSTKPITVGVISPYSGQVGFIKDQLCKSDSICKLEAGANVLDIEVKSIDGFQGKETDIIIFSAVRANQAGRIGFVDDERRMNVALTRGRHAVWILGSASTLCGHSKLWRNLVDDAKQVNCFFKATQVEWMSDVINIFKRHGSSSLQQGDGDERDMGTDRTINFCAQSSMAASPSGRSWEYEEPPQIDGPDWSSVSSFTTTSSPATRSLPHLTLGKRPRAGRDRGRWYKLNDSRSREPHHFRDERRPPQKHEWR